MIKISKKLPGEANAAGLGASFEIFHYKGIRNNGIKNP